MKVEKKIYATPQVERVEILVEGVVLAASQPIKVQSVDVVEFIPIETEITFE